VRAVFDNSEFGLLTKDGDMRPTTPVSRTHQAIAHINHSTFAALIHRLYAVVAELEEMFPGRHFTPDGHMVGSIGECLVADAFGLTLMPSSNEGFDAQDSTGKRVEIKATQSSRVAFRGCPEYTIIVRINKDGTFELYYNGPGKIIWDAINKEKRQSNGQYSVALSRVRELDSTVPDDERVATVAQEMATKIN